MSERAIFSGPKRKAPGIILSGAKRKAPGIILYGAKRKEPSIISSPARRKAPGTIPSPVRRSGRGRVRVGVPRAGVEGPSRPRHLADEPNPFRDRVLQIVRLIPRGRVLTYGQVALLAGTPRAARQVGRMLYFYGGRVPWQRVINHYGGLSTYKVGTGELQRQLLKDEGVHFRHDGTIDLGKYRWRPSARTIKKLELPAEIAFKVNEKLE